MLPYVNKPGSLNSVTCHIESVQINNGIKSGRNVRNLLSHCIESRQESNFFFNSTLKDYTDINNHTRLTKAVAMATEMQLGYYAYMF